MKTIAVILALSSEPPRDDSVIERWWRWTHASHAKSVAEALNSSELFSVKILTSALKDGQLGKEVQTWRCNEVVADLDFSKSAGSNLTGHLRDVSGAYVITEMDYGCAKPLDADVKIGRGIADACLASEVPHVVYSSLAHVSACFGLRSDVCDAKAHVSDYMAKIGLPKTVLYTPFLYEDFLYGFMRPMQVEKSRIYKIAAPTGHIPIDMLAMEDVGKCVKGLFEQPVAWIGKTVALSGDRMTVEEFATQMTDVTYPNIVRDGKVTPEEFVSIFNAPGSEDLANYFDYMTRSVQRSNLATTMTLNQDVLPFYDWVRRNKPVLQGLFSAVVANGGRT